MSILERIPSWLFWVVGILIVIAALVAVITTLVRRAKKKKEEEAKNALPPGAPEDPATEIPRVFANGRKLVQSKVSDKTTRSAIPRLLVIGEPGSGKTTLLGGSGLGAPFGAPSEPPINEPSACRLWFFDSGIAVDVAGAIVLGDTGKREPDAPHFTTVLRELKSDRPERPLDGILLTIPCRDLLPGESTPEDRKRKAALLHKRIAFAQSTLGMNVPVYVLVTQCDLVTGFMSFGNEVSQALRQSMLGWSNPADPTSTKVDEWVDAAFHSVHDALLKEQSRRFAAEGPVRHPDSYFLFPAELDKIADPLRAYIDDLFIPSGFEDQLSLRGIYFCGDLNATNLMAPPSVPVAPGMPQTVTPTLAMEALDVLPGGGVGPHILFVKDLLAKKIFPEANLGRPSVGAVKRRNRGILAIQIAAIALSLFFAAATAITSESLKGDAETINPVLDQIAYALDRVGRREDASGLTMDDRVKLSKDMLNNFAGVSTNRLRSIFIPGSWISGVDSRIEGAIAMGYNRVVCRTYLVRLEERVNELVDESDLDGAISSTSPETLQLEKSQEFLALERWIRSVLTFEQSANDYSVLGSSAAVDDSDVQRVAAVAAYTLTPWDNKDPALVYEVPKSFHSNVKLYRDALRVVHHDPFPYYLYRARAREKAKHLFAGVFNEMLANYKEAFLRGKFASIRIGLEDLERGGPDYSKEQLKNLYDTVVATEAAIKPPTNLSWVAEKGLPEIPKLKELYQLVQKSILLGPEIEVDKRTEGESKLLSLKVELESASAPVVGHILEHEPTSGAVQMQLSNNLLRLKDQIKALLSQGFMAGEDGEPLPEGRDSDLINWNVEVLKDTAKLPKQYEEFNANGGFKNFTDAVRDNLVALSLRQLNRKVLGGVNRAIERAEVPPSDNAKVREASARTQIANFSQAGAPFREMLLAMNRLQQGTTTTRLRGLVTAQGTRLLGVAWDVFSDPEAYRIKQGSFGWWDGEGIPVFEAFDVPDAAGLAERMVAQRVRVDTLGKELAEPVLAVLESGEVNASTNIEPKAVAWHGVVGPLRDYETQKPGNSVSALERFLLTVLPTVTFDNCLLELDKIGGDTGSDNYFTRKRNSIRRLLRERCEYLAKDNVADKYASLRRTFTRSLAERFPFAKTERGVRRDDAAPDAVKKFLEDSSDFRKRYRSFLKARGTSNDREVVRFLDKMENVRAFLLPMWGQSESAVDGVFDVRVDFRVNQAREIGGNQIAEWKLRWGQEKLTLGDNRTTAARWRLNDTVNFDLRWAKNGPNIPKPDREGGVVVRPQSKTATFEEYGVWALLRMIAGHQTSLQDVIGKADTSSHVLVFEVPTEPDNTGGFLDRVGTDAGLVRVFIRLSLSEADKDKLLKYPEFPTVAPAL